MATSVPPTPEDFFREHPSRLAIYERVRSVIDSLGPFRVRVTKSQVAFWCKHGFAYLWMPDMYLSGTGSEVVLSIALGDATLRPASSRWRIPVLASGCITLRSIGLRRSTTRSHPG